jgi:transglutaminase-like putative cysteine protease
VLLTNISYLPGQPSLALVVYLFAAVLLVTRVRTLDAEVNWSQERTTRPPFLSLAVLNVATWLGLALIIAAWLMPTANNWGPVADAWQRALSPVTERLDRLGRLFVGIDAKRADLTHKFGDILPLQGRITLHEDPLFTVVAPDDLPYLRAATYDQYTGNGWRVSNADTEPLEGTSVEAASFGTPATRAQFRRPVLVEVELASTLAERRLLAPGEPLAADIDASLLVGAVGADVIGLVPDGRARAGDTYTAVGTVSAATIETLASAGTNYPSWVRDRYLQLPDSLPPEVGTLAASVVDGSTNPYVAARRIEQFIRGNYPFDLEIADPPPLTDGVAYFLLEARRGYFDHHASAMAVMLRAVGVPARVAVGFALDSRDLDAETKAYEVSGLRAWAWPEVYFAGLGWVEFNPTPSRALVERPGDDSGFGDGQLVFGDEFDAAESLLFDENEIDDTEPPLLPGSTDPGGTTPLSQVGSALSRMIGFVVLAGSAVVVSVLLLRAGWELRYRRLDTAVRRWATLQDLASLAGVQLRAVQTPLEAATALEQATGLDGDLAPLAREYTRARYAAAVEDADPTDEEEQVRQHHRYIAARNRLLRMAMRRLLPARRRKLAVG